MNSNQQTDNGSEFLEEVQMDNPQSVDDFFKELEAKEKDLHISSDLVIEVEDSGFDERKIPDFSFEEPVSRSISPASTGPLPGSFLKTESTLRFESEISELKSRLSKMETERVEMFENSQRRNRDFESFKNRTERDRQENFINQVSNLAMELLPVIDNLGRALECAPQSDSGGQKDFKQFFDGIVLVSQQLNEVLADMGVHPIPAVGEHFDPFFHEAVAIEETSEYPPNVVTSELLRGYKLGEKIVRAAMVKVSTAPKNAAPEIPAEEVDKLVEDLFSEPFGNSEGNTEEIEV
jgi:molecular chaperone GrpE